MELIGKTQEENTDPHTSPPSKTDHSGRCAMSGTIILRDYQRAAIDARSCSVRLNPPMRIKIL